MAIGGSLADVQERRRESKPSLWLARARLDNGDKRAEIAPRSEDGDIGRTSTCA